MCQEPCPCDYHPRPIGDNRGDPLWRDYGADGILRAVAEVYHCSVAQMKGKGRKQRIARARQVAMFLISRKLEWSSTDVGAYMDREHSTVLSNCKVIRNRLSPAEVEEIRKRLRIKRVQYLNITPFESESPEFHFEATA